MLLPEGVRTRNADDKKGLFLEISLQNIKNSLYKDVLSDIMM